MPRSCGWCWCRLRPGEVLEAGAQLAAVVAVAAACDAVRDDSGLIAGVLMGLLVANLPTFDLPAQRPFLETLVQLIIGLLFVSISASVTPASLRHLVLPALGVVVVLVPSPGPVSALATTGSGLPRHERMFIGWMAPRGIVAAATASSFSATLVAADVSGAQKILPVTFLVIVATVAVYGLTAVPVARRLGVTRPRAAEPLMVGGERGWWTSPRAAVAGVEVVMWAPSSGSARRSSRPGWSWLPASCWRTASGEGAGWRGSPR